MKKEYIMSEEDKELKRMKIEQNRNKRKLKINLEKASLSGDEQDQVVVTKKAVKVKQEWSPESSTMDTSDASSSVNSPEPFQPKKELTSNSSAADILNAISSDEKNASQVIQEVMRSQTDAVKVMSQLIEDPSNALVLISHLIKNPADAMLIISKMMSSPLDALSVFTQFMASPTDSLQMIFKIMSSPKDVIQFMSDLTKEPQHAWEAMKRFRANKSDNLQGLNQIILESMSNEAQSPSEPVSEMMKLLEGSSDSPGSSNSSQASFQSVTNSPQVVPFDYSPPDYDSMNDFHHETEKLMNEMCEDLKSSTFYNKSMDSIISEAIKLEYDTPEMACQVNSKNRELNQVEIAKIQELLDSNKALYAPVDEDMTTLMFGDTPIKTEHGMDPMLLRVINLTAIAIRRLIKMSKKISGFKKMCQEDQIALLKVIYGIFFIDFNNNFLSKDRNG
jgi:nuclear receptor subfamily 1 group I